MLIILLRPKILPTAPNFTASALRFRTHGKIYWPGSGIRTKKEVEEEAKCARDGKWPEDNPFDYTIFGTRRVKHSDRFHYTDRKAGKGYTDFSDAHYRQRPYIWTGFRPMVKYYVVIITLLAAPFFIDHKWFIYHGKRLYEKHFKADAATIEEEEENGENGQQNEELNKQTGASDKIVEIPFEGDDELMRFLFIAGIILILFLLIVNMS